MKFKLLAGLTAGTLLVSGCTTAEMQMMNAALAQTAYDMQYQNQQMAQNNFGSGYVGYNGFGHSNQHPTPIARSIGNNYVGYNACRHTGRTYACDTTGNGYADMNGNAQTGEYSSTHLRINGYGEAFTRGSNGQWVRNPAYDRANSSGGRYDHGGYNNGHNGGHYRKQ
ncbi:hypothetical protein [Ponticaulis sp.]|uniref:hypothetical protein n=1 Tax=Ponticaulis sp. TaxID=2020902 RepID=UPI0025CED298|nr:hypothetical protein [Ponticaulis sp.]